MYDIIGDVHGYARQLTDLLEKMGYRRESDSYRHPLRQAIFVGDLIDRGPAIREVLRMVRDMVEAGAAKVVMGNHEWNALLLNTEDPATPGMSLRPKSPKNQKQFSATREQLSDGELNDALEWFRTFPFWLDLEELRVIHACWDPSLIEIVRRLLELYGGVTVPFLISAGTPRNPGFQAVEILLKGKEEPLPEGISFPDKDGLARTAARVRWYLSPVGQTFRTYAMRDQVPIDDPLSERVVRQAVPYPADAPPIFIGHYSMALSPPVPLASNVACLDMNVTQRGILCAYRWSGERQLVSDNFVWVE